MSTMTPDSPPSNDRGESTDDAHAERPTRGSIRDRRPVPHGPLPRQAQVWIMLGLAGLILLVILFTGRPEPTPRIATATPAGSRRRAAGSSSGISVSSRPPSPVRTTWWPWPRPSRPFHRDWRFRFSSIARRSQGDASNPTSCRSRSRQAITRISKSWSGSCIRPT